MFSSKMAKATHSSNQLAINHSVHKAQMKAAIKNKKPVSSPEK